MPQRHRDAPPEFKTKLVALNAKRVMREAMVAVA